MKQLIRDALVSDAPIFNAEKEIAINPGYLVSRPSELVLESFQKKIEVLSRIPNRKYIVMEKDGQLEG